MKLRLIAVLIASVLIPSLGHAQERVSISMNGIGDGFRSAFDYPLERNLLSGKSYGTSGIDVTAKVAITNFVAAGYRYQYEELRNAQSFDRSVVNGTANIRTEPDLGHKSGHEQYQEVFGSFALPKTHGHSFLVGVMNAKLDRQWQWETSIGTTGSEYKDSYTGLVVGGEGKQKLGAVAIDYAGRLFPHLNRTTSGGNTHGELDSSGYELRATATWMVARHIGLTGGYEFRRFRTEGPDSPWVINENQDSKKVIAGVRFSF